MSCRFRLEAASRGRRAGVRGLRRRRPGALLAVLAFGLLGCSPEATPGSAGGPRKAGEPSIRFAHSRDGTEIVDVLGLGRERLRQLGARGLSAAQWGELFTVHSGSFNPPPDQPPMLGTYRVLEDRVRFTPRFPLVPGFRYVATFRTPGAVAVTGHYQVSRQDLTPRTEVVAVYPSGEEVPENLLRLYLHFSDSMRDGEASLRIRLETEAGEEIPLPFVAPGYELWDPDRRRLTLLLDPGRIKRRVGPNLEAGPPLKAGQTVRLRIDGTWPDGRGAPLVAGYDKLYRVGPPDRQGPAPESWVLEPPVSATAPLEVTFSAPVDHGLASRLLRVQDRDGREIPGGVALAGGERLWSFRPEAPWQPGGYRLRVDPALEDPSANRLRSTFETPATDVPGAGRDAEPVELAFEVSGAS